MRRIGWLGVLLVLAACTQGARHWTKAGVTQETADHDYAECESEARQATRREAGIDADILASRGQDWQRTGMLRLQEENMAQHRRISAANIIAQCMGAKGYLRTGWGAAPSRTSRSPSAQSAASAAVTGSTASATS